MGTCEEIIVHRKVPVVVAIVLVVVVEKWPNFYQVIVYTVRHEPDMLLNPEHDACVRTTTSTAAELVAGLASCFSRSRNIQY